MSLSNYILLGCEGTEQCFGTSHMDGTNQYCALGTAALGYVRSVGIPDENYKVAFSVKDFQNIVFAPFLDNPFGEHISIVTHANVYMNDTLKWSREEIAQFFKNRGQ